jgi:hypothetical protein
VDIRKRFKRSQKKSEGQIQAECVDFFRMKYPHYRNLLFAIPNGGFRIAKNAYNLKRQGVVSGVPDMMLAVPSGRYHGLFIEMKRDSQKTTDNQKLMIHRLSEQGYKVVICRSVKQFMDELALYIGG